MQNRFFSDSILLFFKSRARELFGLALSIGAGVLAFALLSYNADDSSLNTSTQAVTKNWLGETGSYLSDAFLQTFGLSAYFWVLIFAVWGVRLMSTKSDQLNFLRVVSAFVGVIGLSMLCVAMPLDKLISMFTTYADRLPHMGGFLGYLSYASHVRMFQNSSVSYLFIPLMVVWAGLSLSLIWYALGLSLAQLKAMMATFYNGLLIVIVGVGQGIHYLFFWGQAKIRGQEYTPEPEAASEWEYAHEREFATFETVDAVPVHDWNQEDALPFDAMLEDEPEVAPKKKRKKEDFVMPAHMFQRGEYTLPPLELLDKTVQRAQTISQDAMQEQARLLESVLNEFGIRGDIVNIRPGPVVTMYELKPAPGIKTSRVIGLSDDIARSMSALSARIAVIPGQNVIGIELPNRTRNTVFLRELLNATEYSKSEAKLPLILGQDIGGHPMIADLAKMPHLLVAGTTGSGKSVSVNAMILSLLFKLPPSQCKFIMIDPKMLELSIYDDIPHLLTPVVTDPKKAIVALKWAVKEMENRYRSMSKLGVRNIDGFNERLQDAKTSGEILVRRVQTGFDPETGKPIFENQGLDYEPLPYIVVVVDEMADLMLVAGKEIEATIQRLAQMARAAGIHLIMATQRPSVDVITGTIKANFPTRISFQVTSKIDSRTILSEQGAEQLLGQGDMLYMAGGGRIMRVHGPYIKDPEVERIVTFLKAQGEPTYIDGVTDDDEEMSVPDASPKGGDAVYNQAVEVIMREGKVSTSFIQRHLQIGYNRAARIVEQMEKEGLISAPNHAGKREIMM